MITKPQLLLLGIGWLLLAGCTTGTDQTASVSPITTQDLRLENGSGATMSGQVLP